MISWVIISCHILQVDDIMVIISCHILQVDDIMVILSCHILQVDDIMGISPECEMWQGIDTANGMPVMIKVPQNIGVLWSKGKTKHWCFVEYGKDEALVFCGVWERRSIGDKINSELSVLASAA
jgi:hypothetical protein